MSNVTALQVKTEYDEAALMRVLRSIEVGEWPTGYPRPTGTPEYLGRHRGGDERIGRMSR